MDDRSNPTPGDLTNPSGTMFPADLPGTISPKDIEQARQWMRNDLGGAFANLRDGMRSGLIDGFADAIRGIVRPGFQSVRDAWVDGQLSLREGIDETYSSLEEQGTAFMSTSNAVWNSGKGNFDSRLTGSKGVRFEQGGITMLDRGQWQINAMITADWIAINWSGWGDFIDTSRVSWEIRVIAPDGSVYHRKTGAFTGQGPMNDSLFTSVHVPGSGFRAEVHVNSIAPLRGLLRGPRWNHLSVSHINRTGDEGGANGNEPSDNPSGG